MVCKLNKVFFYSILILSANQVFAQLTTPFQKSNYFITKTSSNKTFISSIDGFSINDGLNIKSYSPSEHNMYGFNIQSEFYETSLEEVWFVTYEALNVYKPRSDEIEYYFIDSSHGDIIKSDYKIMDQIGDSLLVGASNKLFLFDTKIREKRLEIPIDLERSISQELYLKAQNYKLVSTSKRQVDIYEISFDFETISKDSIPMQAVSCRHIDEDICLLGTDNGEIVLFDFENKTQIYYNKLYEDGRVSGIVKLGGSEYLITSSNEMLYVFDVDKNEIRDSLVLKNPNSSKPSSNFLFPFLDRDSCLWIGSDGIGVLSKDFKKEKFEHILRFGYGQTQNRITSIKLNNEENKITIGTRGDGLYLLDANLELIDHFKSRLFILNHYWLNENEIVFHYGNKIEKLDILTGKTTSVMQFDKDDFILSMEKIDRKNYLISLGSNAIFHLNMNSKELVESIIEIDTLESPFQRLKIDSEQNIFVSKNDQSIWKYKKENRQYILEDSLDIQGGIKSILEPSFDPLHWFITNTHGIFKVNKQTNSVEKIKDKNGILNGTIYGMIEDDHQYLWLSSNQGILKYNIESNEVTSYTLKDGLQDMEFNTNAFMKDKQGRIWMGGVNGLNVFHPDDVKPSPTLATVCIDDFQIDGKSSREFGIGDYIEHVEVDYGTPFSFFFHAIDYGDIERARLKYKLIGSDEAYVNVDNYVESIRYNKLGSGNYTLEIFAANSDGVWNPNPKLISVNVIPPFWMTWWFILLASLAVLWFTYYSFKSYYRRKIEKQNVKLREQELIIQSQQALVNERNRIATEMHDDLGSGLTRIKYLSDGLVKTIKGIKERDSIFRISKYSEELIRNMSEIIWAMNSRFDNFNNLIAYIRRYASEYLGENNVNLSFGEFDFTEKIEVSGEKRRNVFLAIKEALHNLVKYSGASQVQIEVENNESEVKIILQEINGKRFDLLKAKEKGNGIYNMEKRMNDVGNLEIAFDNRGTRMIFTVNKN